MRRFGDLADEAMLKRLPRGYAADHPAAELLRHQSYTVGRELSERELIEHASHGDQHSPFRIMRDAGRDEEQADSVYGEADAEHLED